MNILFRRDQRFPSEQQVSDSTVELSCRTCCTNKEVGTNNFGATTLWCPCSGAQVIPRRRAAAELGVAQTKQSADAWAEVGSVEIDPTFLGRE